MNNNIISYSDDFENLLKQEAEKSEAMAILHNKAYLKFSKLSIALNIPVIVVSSVIGFLSPLSIFEYQNIFLGALSIGVAILKTTDNYFDISKRCETHRLTANAYNRVSKWIQLQLSLERECRVAARDLFDIISNEIQNIRESEPLITDDLIYEFNSKYGLEKTAKPAITNGLTDIKINKKKINKVFFNIPSLDRKISNLADDREDIINESEINTNEKIILEIEKEIKN